MERADLIQALLDERELCAQNIRAATVSSRLDSFSAGNICMSAVRIAEINVRIEEIQRQQIAQIRLDARQ
jgi:hypothetical protein